MTFAELFEVTSDKLEQALDAEFPACWPNRPGDAAPFDIFTNVGLALSRWERVEVSLLETVRGMQVELANSNKVVRSYSRQRNIREKLKVVSNEFQRGAKTQSHLLALEKDFVKALKRYTILKIARNRLAHGVVLIAGPVFMDELENGMIPTYQLHPSEGDQRNWVIAWDEIQMPNGTTKSREGNDDKLYINDGPIFSYMAIDIQKIGAEFYKLDIEFQRLTKNFVGSKVGFEELLHGFEVDPCDLSL